MQVIIATKTTIPIKPNQQLKVAIPILVVKNVEVELGLENNKINRKVVFFFCPNSARDKKAKYL
jgi:hypothetical protein